MLVCINDEVRVVHYLDGSQFEKRLVDTGVHCTVIGYDRIRDKVELRIHHHPDFHKDQLVKLYKFQLERVSTIPQPIPCPKEEPVAEFKVGDFFYNNHDIMRPEIVRYLIDGLPYGATDIYGSEINYKALKVIFLPHRYKCQESARLLYTTMRTFYENRWKKE